MIRRALYNLFGLKAERTICRLNAATHRPRETQLEKLLTVLGNNLDTEFGREHNFSAIKSIADYQRALPVRDYSGHQPYIERVAAGQKNVLTTEDPLMFATTSGTTAEPKYIPVTPSYMDEYRLASVVSGYHLLRSFPGMTRGITLSVVSPAEEGRTAGGTPYGAISGQLFQREPYLIKRYISPVPYEVYLIRDYETRYYTLLRLALVLPLSCFYTLNPSTISLLCRRLRMHGESLIADVRKGTITPPGQLHDSARAAISKFLQPNAARAAELMKLLNSDDLVPHRIWPELAVVSCWTKAAAAFYLADFPQYFGSVPVSDITYGASEGRGTVFMGAGKQMLALHTHFFEFIPEDEIEKPAPTVLVADELEVGKKYYILFTTSGGLYRYNINDVVKVTGFHNRTPMLEFQYKGGNVCSFTGEKITELQVTSAMTKASTNLGIRTRFFTVIPRFRPEPHYEAWIEFDSIDLSDDQQKELAVRLCQEFDRELGRTNIEYATKRESNRLGKVASGVLKGGAYESLRKELAGSGVADAQIKASHLNPKEAVFKYLEGQLRSEQPEVTANCLTVV